MHFAPATDARTLFGDGVVIFGDDNCAAGINFGGVGVEVFLTLFGALVTARKNFFDTFSFPIRWSPNKFVKFRIPQITPHDPRPKDNRDGVDRRGDAQGAWLKALRA